MTNPFYLPAENYKRDLKFVEGYHKDAATYLQLMTGDSLEQCLAFVKSTTAPEGARPMVSPKTLITNKSLEGDRSLMTVSFLQVVARVEKEDLLLSPSMAAYMPESKRKSTHAIYIEEGVANRKKVKGEMFQAERALAAPDLTQDQVFFYEDLKVFKKGAQNNLKINNNSYSGATVSQATILHYKSTHSSLTSTCRVATSYANASNEKFIAGNRHYYNPEITKANLLFIMNNTDLDLIDRVCQDFNLHYPSVDDTCEMVAYSSDNYWKSPDHKALIRLMVEGMTPVQRAAVVYSGDMYQLFNHNRALITDFLNQLSTPTEYNPQVGEMDEKIYKNQFDDDLKMLATFLCFEDVKGRDTKQLLESSPEVHAKVKATALGCAQTLKRFETLIHAFFLSPVMPSSIHAFPTIYRKAVPISDTDSTMFTLQWWVEQIYGAVVFTPEAKRTVFSLVFLISQVVMHQLALLSTNMGVKAAKLRLLAMKNEYYFSVLNLTTRSKHYHASRDAQEGIMKLIAEEETKGVGLRDSKVPPKLQKIAKSMMKEIRETIKEGRLISVRSMLKRIADIERSIIESLESGSFEYLTTGQIKGKTAYKNEDNATFKQWELWRDVFAPSFGATQPPPYSVVKISLAVNNKTDMELWYAKMNNPALAERFKTWMFNEQKTEIGTMLIPASVVEGTGVPREITCAIDTRRIISNTMPTFYLMLESLGIFLIDKNNVRLISDYY